MHKAKHIGPARTEMRTWQQDHYLHRLQHWWFRKAEADSQEQLHTAGQVRSCRGWGADHSQCFLEALQRQKLSSHCRRTIAATFQSIQLRGTPRVCIDCQAVGSDDDSVTCMHSGDE